jgi:hypothetical protein
VWTIEMLWRIFKRIINDEKLRPMFVIIDALGMFSSDNGSCCGCRVKYPANSAQMSAKRKHVQPF